MGIGARAIPLDGGTLGTLLPIGVTVAALCAIVVGLVLWSVRVRGRRAEATSRGAAHGRVWRRSPWAIVPAALLALAVVYAIGVDFQFSVGGWANGDTLDSMWSASIIDLPGMSIIDVNCRGQGQIVIQLGATRQPNPCYAFINSVPSETWGWYMWLPANQVVWRCSKNGGPYRYIVGVDSGPLAPSNRMDPNACQ